MPFVGLVPLMDLEDRQQKHSPPGLLSELS